MPLPDHLQWRVYWLGRQRLHGARVHARGGNARGGLSRRRADSVKRHEREINLFPQELRPQNGHSA
jgi:hypothetical protein